MSTTSILPGSAVVAARPDQTRAAWRARFKRAGLALWRGLEAFGQARAERELRTLHERWELSDPERAQVVRDAHAFLVSQRAPHR